MIGSMRTDGGTLCAIVSKNEGQRLWCVTHNLIYPIRVLIRLCIREDILKRTFYPQLVPRNPNSFITIPTTIIIASQWGKCQHLL
jgi:hypothetical protein